MTVWRFYFETNVYYNILLLPLFLANWDSATSNFDQDKYSSTKTVDSLLLKPVQFSADVYNHYDMKQRSLFIAPLVVIYCRELALHHRPQGATWNKGLHHLK